MRAALLGLGLGVARALGQDYCPGSDDATAQAPAYLPFRTGTAWPDLATLVRSRNASRGYVELAGALRCYDLYDFGVLTRFDQALLAGDVVVDCLGPVVPDGIGERPDLARATFAASRTRFRPAFSPRRYAEERDASKAVAGRSFRVGVSLTYVRDGNFEMFYAVDVSRWWYVLQMLSAGWAPEGPVAIVLSGRDGGSGAAPHAYVREAMELLIGTLPFDAEIVTLDEPLFFEELWVPGFAAMNLADCAIEDRYVASGPQLSDVLSTLRAAARARPLGPAHGHSRSQLECAAGSQGKIFVTRLDGVQHGLDGVERHLSQEQQLIADLMDSGFGVVSAADYDTVEKAALFGRTDVMIVEAGAGVTNAMFLAPNATVVVLCSPDYEGVRFGTRWCDWYNSDAFSICVLSVSLTPQASTTSIAGSASGRGHSWLISTSRWSRCPGSLAGYTPARTRATRSSTTARRCARSCTLRRRQTTAMRRAAAGGPAQQPAPLSHPRAQAARAARLRSGPVWCCLGLESRRGSCSREESGPPRPSERSSS